MSKILIIGTTRSGKTCYFYSMLHKMLIGGDGFSLRINSREQYRKLYMGIKTLGNTALSDKERWPQASFALEKYELDLLYNMEKLDTLEWVDYPGEHVSKAVDEFMDLLDGATSLFVCVDGTQLQFDEDEIEEKEEELEDVSEEDLDDELEKEEIPSEMINEFGKRRSVAMLHYLKDIAADFYTQSGMEICNALTHAVSSDEKKAYPPVCILLTKYDAVSPEFQDMTLISQFAKYCFPTLFNKGSGKGRMVMICPVSLGKDIAKGGKLRPKNVECPICFVTYLVRFLMIDAMREQAREHIALNEKKVQEYNKKGFIGKMIPKNKRPQSLTEEQKNAILELVNNSAQDLKELRKKVAHFPLYINGEQSNWPDVM